MLSPIAVVKYFYHVCGTAMFRSNFPTKMGREVSGLFSVSEVMTPLVTFFLKKAFDCEINSAALFHGN